MVDTCAARLNPTEMTSSSSLLARLDHDTMTHCYDVKSTKYRASSDRMTPDDVDDDEMLAVFDVVDRNTWNSVQGVLLRRPESLWFEYLFEWDPLAAEIEAIEVCEWLREAGFPQYVQMYRDGQFPVDMESVKRDHAFLEPDDLEALFRRLRTLEKSARLKLKTSHTQVVLPVDESDDEDLCALSDRWRYQRNNRQWARLDANHCATTDAAADAASNQSSKDRSSNQSPAPVSSSSFQFRRNPSSPSAATPPPSVDDDFVYPVTSALEAHSTLRPHHDGLDKLALHLPLRASSSSPVTRPACAAHHRRSGSTSGHLAPSQSPSTCSPEPNGSTLSRRAGSPSPSAVSSDFLLPCAVGALAGAQFMSDSERSSNSSASVSPGQMRRAPSDRFRGAAWNLLKKVENRLMSRRRSAGGSRRGSSATGNDCNGSPTMSIGAPTMVENAAVRAKLESLKCVDLSRLQAPVSPTASVTACKPSISSSLESRSLSTSNPGSPLTVSPGSCQLSPTMARSLTRSPREPPCPGEPTLPSLVNGQHSVANGFEMAEEDDTVSTQSLLSRRNQRSLVVGIADSGTQSVSRHPSTRSSVYDNVTGASPSLNELAVLDLASDDASTTLQNSSDDVLDAPRTTLTDAEKELDAILSSLYRDISWLSRTLNVVVDGRDTDSSVADSSVVVDPDLQLSAATVAMDTDPLAASSRLSSTLVSCSEAESPDSGSDPKEDDWSYPDEEVQNHRERRDSGVGSSLTRSSSSKKQNRAPRIRWHSFARSHRPYASSDDHHIATMSAGLLAVLHRICMLKITATLEKYLPSNKTGRSWFVPRLMKRARTPDYSNRRVFGVPLSVIQQRHGQPLLQCILYAMRRLRRSASDSESVGVFRKSGVRSRILALRNEIEADPDSIDFDSLAPYDVADVLKLYFRELPECLLTNKLSHVFVSIFLHVPPEKRLDLLKATILLLPDGHREALQSLLLFLSDMAKYAEQNQMNARNLAICFAPSLFHLCGCWKVSGADASSSSSKRTGGNSRRSGGDAGMLTEKDLAEQRASHECLTFMITSSKEIFTLPQEMVDQCHLTYMEQGDPVPLEELLARHGRTDTRNHAAHVDTCINGLLKESRDKFKGWVSLTSSSSSSFSDLDEVDLAYKKVGDGHPLRLWKSCVEVEAPPIEVLERVLRERHLWDDDVIKWRVVERLDAHTEVFQYVMNAMVPHPTRDFCELRSWRVNLSNGVCVLVSTSVEHKDAPLMGGVRGVTLASRYLIEPCGSGKSRLTHVSRVDLRGRTPEWYVAVYGRWFTNYARRIRSSFQNLISVTGDGVQETNV